MAENSYDAQLGKAWDEFCDRLKEAGQLAFRKTSPQTETVRASGIHYIAQFIPQALDDVWNYRDVLYPQLHPLMTPVSKSFGDNPDCTYLTTWIDGRYTNRVVGKRGTATWVSFIVSGLNSLEPTDTEDLRPEKWRPYQRQVGLINRDLKTNWDGSFELILSPQKPDGYEGNWMQTVPGIARFMARQFFGEWDTEEPMRIRIERVGAEKDGPPPLLTANLVKQRLRETMDYLLSETKRWVDMVEWFGEWPNQFVSQMPPFTSGGAQNQLDRKFQFCHWRVQPDEALVIEVTPPPCVFWNFEFNNYWMTSADYRYRMTTLNNKQSVLEDDSSVRIVVAHQDPGVPNWLDCAGHTVGLLNQRWVEPVGSLPVPTVKLVKAADLFKVIPTNTKRITSEGRREQLRRRKIGVDRRFAV